MTREVIDGEPDNYQPLWNAFIAATYLLNRYRHLHAGRSVRDLDEAEARLETCKKRLDEWAAKDDLIPIYRTSEAP